MYSSEHIITSKHYLILCVCAFCAGILFSVRYPAYCQTVKYAAYIICAVLAATVFLVLIFKKRSRRIKPFLLPLLLTAFVLLGILRCESFDNRRTVLDNCAGKLTWFYGRVVSPPSLSSNGQYCRFELNVRAVELSGFTAKTNEDIMLTAPPSFADTLTLNDTVIFWGEPTSINSKDSSVSESYAKYLKSKNIFFTAKAQTLRESALPPGRFSVSDSLRRLGIILHTKIAAACDAMFFENPNINAMIKGILIGDKSDFSPELYDSLSNAGISHIAAVSGMHMSILFSAVTYLLSFTGLNKKSVMLLSLPAILLFAAASAFTPSVCRSAAMLSVMILSVLTGQRYTPVNSLFLALGLILCKSPYAIFSSGLLLSFGAALGILTFCKYISVLLCRILRRIPHRKAVAEALSVSLSSFIGTAFSTAVFFDRISLIQFVTNLWIIPLVTFTFCAGYLCCAVYSLFPAAAMHVFRYTAAGGGELIYLTAKVFASDRFSLYAPIGYLPCPMWVIYAAVILILYFSLKLAYDNVISSQNTALC